MPHIINLQQNKSHNDSPVASASSQPPAVIASLERSEKRSNPLVWLPLALNGLRRRSAPRNDQSGWLRRFFQSKRNILAGFIVAIIVIILSFVLFRNSEQVKAEWFNDSWHYRMQFDVFNASTTQALTDFQVRISTTTLTLSTLYANNKVKTDYSDLRFTDASGNLLDYWFPDATSTMGAVYVKFPNLPKNATSTLYMYYGNNSADNERKTGQNFFLFYDDFSNTTYTNNNWQNVGQTPANCTYSQASGYIQVNSSSGACIKVAPSFNLNDYTVEALTRHVTSPGSSMGLILRADTSGNYYHQEIDGSSLVTYIFTNWSYTSGQSTAVSVSADRWYEVRFKAGGTSIQAYSYTHNATVNATYTSFASGRPGVQTWANNARFDEFRVRKYAQTEPNVVATVGASEEIGGGPVGYWKFDEGYGTTAYDSSSYKNNGTLTSMSTTGTSTAWTTGKVGKALLFDGVNDRVAVTGGNYISNQGTISFWLKTEKDAYNDAIHIYETGYADYLLVRKDTGNTILLRIEDNDVGLINLNTVEKVTLNEWHHVAVTQDGTGIKIYIDGVSSRLTGTNANNWTGHLTATSLNISPSSWGVFDGLLDEVKIYNYALTASQILTEYNQNKSVILSQTAEQVQNSQEGLVGWYKMDETPQKFASTTNNNRINDYSGGGNNLISKGWTAGTDGPQATTTAKYGNAAELKGTDDYLCSSSNGTACADNDNLDMGKSDFTVEAWIKTSADDNSRILSKYYAPTFKVNDNGKLAIALIDDLGNNSGWLYSNSTVNNNSWRHVSAVVDRTNKIVKFYVDGSFDGQSSISVINGNLSNGYSFVIGSTSGSDTFFTGLIDEVKVYKTARTPDQIMQDYLQGPSPIAYYDFEEGQGTTLSDKSGQGNNSSSFGGGLGASSDWVKGKYGRALDFDGTDDDVNFGDQANFDMGTGNFSVGLWVKIASSYTTSSYIINKAAGAGANGWGLYYYNSRPYFEIYPESGSRQDTYLATSKVINDNKWHYLIGTVDRAGLMKCYIDGELVNDIENVSAQAARTISNAYSMKIGEYGAGTSGNLNGQVDEVKIYNYALTPWQIAQEYNQGDPISQWSFDEGYGTTAYNTYATSTNALVGTLTNMSTTGTSTVWTTGKVGKALLFDGVNDYVAIGNKSSHNLTSNGSITGWIKLAENIGTDHWAVVLSKDNWGGDRNGYACYFQGNTRDFRCVTADSSSVAVSSSSGISKFVNNWKHFVFTWDSLNQKLYIDGDLVDQDTPKVASPSSYSLYIGSPSSQSPTYNFMGLIDELKIYNYALSPSQIKKDYNDSKAVVMGTSDGGQAVQQGLVAWYKMDEATTTWDGAGDRVNDYSGNNNAGTAYAHAHATTTAQYGNAGEFDGDDDYVSANLGSITTRQFTQTLWLKKSALSGVHRLNNSYPVSWGFTGNVLFVHVQTSSGTDVNIIYKSVPTITNQWTMITIIVDTLTTNTVKVYLNGSLFNSASLVNSVNGTLTIGTFNIGNSTNSIDGVVDDVKIYNIARTPDQIMQDYLQGPGPIAYYDFEEGSGTTANDKSGQGHNGTITAGTGGYKKGRIGQAYDFDASTTNINTGSDWISTQALSISTWVYADGWGEGEGGTRGVIIANDTSPGGGSLSLYIRSNGNVGFTSNATIITSASNSFSLKKWYHILVTRTAQGIANFYINGSLSSTADRSSGVPAPGDMNVIIGNDDGNYTFDGKIDDLKVYNYVLTPWQIAQEYNGGKPVGWWLLDEGEGSAIHDNSGNNYNGSLILNGSPATSTAWQVEANCKTGRCLDFDGTDDYVYIKNGALISNVNYSITGWIKIEDLMSSDGIIFSNDNDSANTIVDTIGIENGKLSWNYDSAGTYKAGSTNGFNLNEWGHFAFVSDDGRTGTIKIYINGAEDAITTTGFYRSGADVRIGGRNSSNKPFIGSMDDVRIYNYALSPQQIREVYNSGFGTYFK